VEDIAESKKKEKETNNNRRPQKGRREGDIQFLKTSP
jgi:hypothetical protein